MSEEDFQLTEAQIEEWEASLRHEMDQTVMQEDPVASTCKIIEFTSFSAGKGRQRKPREVTLLRYRGGTHDVYYQVSGDTMLPRRDTALQPDIVAQQVLSHLPQEDQRVDVLLELAWGHYRRGLKRSNFGKH